MTLSNKEMENNEKYRLLMKENKSSLVRVLIKLGKELDNAVEELNKLKRKKN